MPSTLSKPLSIAASKHVRVVGVGTALPTFQIAQSDALEFILSHFEIKDRTKQLYKKLLLNPSIQTRHFCLENLAEVMEKDHGKISLRFESSVRDLATRALLKTLRHSGVRPDELDYIITTTCTGYICPGVSSHLIETCLLRSNIEQVDLTGMGCGAAMPALNQARNFLEAHPNKTAAVVSVEICTAAMFTNDDPDVVISNSIFADGAAAVVLSSRSRGGRVGDMTSLFPILIDFASRVKPEWRESLRFVNENGYLKNRLGKNVPEQSAELAESMVAEILSKWNLSMSDIKRWILHPGGEKVLNTVAKRLNLLPDQIKASQEILRLCGNMSSPSVLFVLEKEMEINPPKSGEWGIVSAFGAGFSGYAMLVQF